jgi:hypothetical protein
VTICLVVIDKRWNELQEKPRVPLILLLELLEGEYESFSNDSKKSTRLSRGV